VLDFKEDCKKQIMKITCAALVNTQRTVEK